MKIITLNIQWGLGVDGRLDLARLIADAPALLDAWPVANGGAPHPTSFFLFDQTLGQPHCCDFVFVTEDLAPRMTRIAYDQQVKSSDHQPVLIELDL
jgi:endonuclease/exonuclease/phosphatase family metal-dependent hydrolase